MSLAYTVLFSVLAVVIAVVSGLPYRARRAARVRETADVAEAVLEAAAEDDLAVEPPQAVVQAPGTRMRSAVSRLARIGRS